MPLRIKKGQTDSRTDEIASPVKPFSSTRKYFGPVAAGVVPALTGWLFANRLLFDPAAWNSAFWHGLAWAVLILSVLAGVYVSVVRSPRKTLLPFVILLGVVSVRLWVVDVVRVLGPSMEPTLHDGDVLVIEKWSTGMHLPALDFPATEFRQDNPGPPGSNIPGLIPRMGWRLPARGELIVFDYPDGGGGGRTYVKRVVGLPGDRYAFAGGRIRIEAEDGGVLLDEPAGVLPDVANPVLEAPGALKDLDTAFMYFALNGIGRSGSVPPGGLLVLGDHRSVSRDSRSLGFIPMSFVQGRVLLWF